MKNWWNNLSDGWKGFVIAIPFLILILYANYVHRDEPHWMEIHYVKIIK